MEKQALTGPTKDFQEDGMSDKEWFSGLTFDDVIGKHVRIEMKDRSIIKGRLNSKNGAVVVDDGDLEVFEPSMTVFSPYQLNSNIESISLVWDERDWEQIPKEDANKANAVVFDGRLLCVTGVDGEYFLVDDFEHSIPFYSVSHVLRYRYEFPSEPGAYRSNNGDLVFHVQDKLIPWIIVKKDYTDSLCVINEPTEKFKLYRLLPLIPVHFVDGKKS